MKLLQTLVSRFRSNWNWQWSEAADDVADRCFERVWQLVAERVTELNPAQTRGYVHARAALVLKNAVSASYPAADAQQIYALAMDVSVQRVTQQAFAVRARQLRRAA